MKDIYIPSKKILDKVVQSYQTPILLTSAQTIRERAKQMIDGFSSLNTKIFYAIKANYNPSIVQLIKSAGIDGIDAVSPFEVRLALENGFSPEQIMFTGNNVSDEEMQWVGEQNVLQNIGSLSELERFGRFFPKHKVSVRFSPQIGAGEFDHVVTGGDDTKFGISHSDFHRVKELLEKYQLKLSGLHMHMGSGFYCPDTFWQAASMLIQVAKDFKDLDFLDFGGGFGVNYTPNQSKLNLKAFAGAIEDLIYDFDKQNGKAIEIRIEPGKFLVSESTVLLAKVTGIKEKGGLCFVGINTGMNTLIRPAMYGAYHHIINFSNAGASKKFYRVVGNICESGDLFHKNIELSEVREGDILAILNAGAYTSSMSSNYNLRPFVAELLLDEDELKLTRKKQSYEQILENYL